MTTEVTTQRRHSKNDMKHFPFRLVLKPYEQYLIWYRKSMLKVHYMTLVMHFMTWWMSSGWTMWSYVLDGFVRMPGICALIRIAGGQKSPTLSFWEHWEYLFSVFTNELFKPTSQSSSLIYTSSWVGDVYMIQIRMALFWCIKSPSRLSAPVLSGTYNNINWWMFLSQ